MVSISNNLLKCIKRLISYFIIGHSSTSWSLFLLTFCNCILCLVFAHNLPVVLFVFVGLWPIILSLSKVYELCCTTYKTAWLYGFFLLFNIKSALLIYIHRRAFALTLAVVEFRVSHGNNIYIF